PASSVAITRGGRTVRSITDMRLSGTCFVGSEARIFIAEVTSAIDSSGVIATDVGGPTTLVGASISATTARGPGRRSVIAAGAGAQVDDCDGVRCRVRWHLRDPVVEDELVIVRGDGIAAAPHLGRSGAAGERDGGRRAGDDSHEPPPACRSAFWKVPRNSTPQG